MEVVILIEKQIPYKCYKIINKITQMAASIAVKN